MAKDIRMKFEVFGTKARPKDKSISEVDLLTDSKRSIRARQRGITTLKFASWENASIKNKYDKAIITLRNIFSN